MWVATTAALLFTLSMGYFFEQRGAWSIAEFVFLGVFLLISFGLVMALIDANRFWWGMRIVSFVIFAVLFGNLLFQFWFTSHPLELSTNRSPPMHALFGFLLFGVPALLYSFWGSTWGRLGHRKVQNVSRWDVATFFLAWTAGGLCLLLSVAALVATLWRAFAS